MHALTSFATASGLAFALAVSSCGGAEQAVTAPVAPTASAGAQPEILPDAAAAGDIDAATAVHAHARCVLAVDLAAARTVPLAGVAASALAILPPFDALGATFDPLHDADWLVYTGPRFFPNRDAAFIVGYTGDDAAMVGHYHDLAERGDVEQEAGAAPRGMVDHFPRALLAPQPGILAMVPPALAARVTRALDHGNVVPPLHPGEVARVSMRRPGGVSTLVPDSVYEARAWAVARGDGGADLFAELDCPFESEAVVVSNQLRRTIAAFAKGGARAAAHGLLDAVEVKPEESKVKLHVAATAEQAEALVGLLQDRLRSRAPP